MVTGKQNNQRLGVLCDADNLEIIPNRPRRLCIDLRALLERMNGRELVRAIYFRPEKGFPDSVRHAVMAAGFEVATTFKNSDPWIAAAAFAMASKYDVIAFVGGDGDLEPLLILLKAFAVRTEVWSWPEKMSARVRTLADAFVPLSRDLIIESMPD